MKQLCIALSIAMLLSGISFAQSDSEDVEEILQQKVRDYTALMYKGQPEAYAELFAEDAVIPEENIEGTEMIKSMIARWQIPPTEYAIEFYPIAVIDSNYIMSYKVNETSGFALELVEVWKRYDGELKISFASIVEIMPSDASSGISMQRFILSSLILGVFLFLLFLIFKNAASWKGSR